MKLNLGRFILILFAQYSLFANIVELSVDRNVVFAGDNIQVTLSAKGENIVFPNINSIGQNAVISVSTSSSTSIINGRTSKSLSKTMTIPVAKTFTIPSYQVKVDGHIYRTSPKKIKVAKPVISKNGDNFILKLKVDNKNLIVGQSAKLTVLFKQKITAKADKLELSTLKLDNFWKKKIPGVRKTREGNYIVQQYSFLIFAQKEGDFVIEPMIANIGKVVNIVNGSFISNFFEPKVSWKKIFSNPLKIKVKSLSNNLELYGSFVMSAEVDKKIVKSNKPVSLTIKVQGVGNIDDVQPFKLDMQNKTVYADTPKIQSAISNMQYQGVFTQSIAIVSDENFTIPSFSLTYVDNKTKKIKTIQTQPIDIEVLPSKYQGTQHLLEQSNTLPTQIKSKIIYQKEPFYIKLIYMLFGIFIGIALMYFYLENIKKYKKTNNMIEKIKNAKDDNALYDILLPYAKQNNLIMKTLQDLEENIYKNTEHKVDKQHLYDIFFDLKLNTKD